MARGKARVTAMVATRVTAVTASSGRSGRSTSSASCTPRRAPPSLGLGAAGAAAAGAAAGPAPAAAWQRAAAAAARGGGAAPRRGRPKRRCRACRDGGGAIRSDACELWRLGESGAARGAGKQLRRIPADMANGQVGGFAGCAPNPLHTSALLLCCGIQSASFAAALTRWAALQSSPFVRPPPSLRRSSRSTPNRLCRATGRASLIQQSAEKLPP
jgi:hypothetical protein